MGQVIAPVLSSSFTFSVATLSFDLIRGSRVICQKHIDLAGALYSPGKYTLVYLDGL